MSDVVPPILLIQVLHSPLRLECRVPDVSSLLWYHDKDFGLDVDFGKITACRQEIRDNVEKAIRSR